MKRLHFAPLIILGLVAALSTILILGLALSRPWIGATLSADGETVIVSAVYDSRDDLQRGDVLRSVRGPSDEVAVTATDLIDEPDGLPTTADMFALFARSGRLDAMLRSGNAELVLERGGETVTAPAVISDHRPLTDLPAVFWVQLIVGLSAMLVGGWVMVLRPQEMATRWLMLTAIGLMIASQTAALYSTRELALPEFVFDTASRFNSSGSILFGIGMIAFFLTYPVRYLPRWLVMAVSGVFAGWLAFSFLRLGKSPETLVHLPVLTEMAFIVVAATAQVWVSRGNPSARAAMRWFGLSVVIGSGAFVGLIAAPQALGLAPAMSQGYAFGFFLIVYAGLATGVARYRLFDLEFWAFRALFYAGGVVFLLLLDALLVYAVAVDRIPAFSISLLVVAFAYLPMRDYLSRLLTGRQIVTTSDLFDLVSQAALAPGAQAQGESLRRLMDELFQPLTIEAAPERVMTPTLLDEGEGMDVPGIEGAPDLRMKWALRGRRLFSLRDVETVRAALQMTAQVVERRRAYESGAEEERQRINRDMHDHIGAQLLGALHSQSDSRKNALIRQTLTDLREIVSNPGGDPIRLESLLGDLRAELSEHLGSADITLDWTSGALPDVSVTPMVVSSIRAVLREGMSNILRHSGAQTAYVETQADQLHGQDWLILTVRDDGTGPIPGGTPAPNSGNGLRNLAVRLESRGGSFSAGRAKDGTGMVLSARLPLQIAGEQVVRLRDASE